MFAAIFEHFYGRGDLSKLPIALAIVSKFTIVLANTSLRLNHILLDSEVNDGNKRCVKKRSREPNT